MSFAKLDSGIIKSSLWAEPPETRVLWVTMLAMKDENGFVSTSRSGLLRAANIPQDKFEEAIKTIESPDPDSRTPEHDGIRAEKIDGGWVILNHEKYRLHDDVQRNNTRERVKKFREKKNMCNVSVTLRNVTETLPSVSVSESVLLTEEKKLTEFETALEAFKEMRKKIKKPLTEHATNLLAKELQKLAPNDERRKIEILNRSTFNSWQGVFPLKDGSGPVTMAPRKFVQ
jgi:hypothetical protein